MVGNQMRELSEAYSVGGAPLAKGRLHREVERRLQHSLALTLAHRQRVEQRLDFLVLHRRHGADARDRCEVGRRRQHAWRSQCSRLLLGRRDAGVVGRRALGIERNLVPLGLLLSLDTVLGLVLDLGRAETSLALASAVRIASPELHRPATPQPSGSRHHHHHHHHRLIDGSP